VTTKPRGVARWADVAGEGGQMSVGEYRRFVGRWNPESYRKLSQNKIAEKAILTLFHVPTPRFLGPL
jgi:hypothetical protein